MNTSRLGEDIEEINKSLRSKSNESFFIGTFSSKMLQCIFSQESQVLHGDIPQKQRELTLKVCLKMNFHHSL